MRTRVYLADTGSLEDPALFAALMARMPTERREKAGRFRFERDRRLSLGAWALLACALKNAGVEEPGEIALSANGKPYFPSHPELRFSLSHSGTAVMCILSDREVGCDVEKVRARPPKVAERFFAPEERALLDALPGEREKTDMFCRLWTLKESFMKVTGLGFRLPGDAFAVLPENDGFTLRQSVDAADYCFFEFDYTPAYRCACCVRDAPERPALRAEVVDLAAEAARFGWTEPPCGDPRAE